MKLLSLVFILTFCLSAKAQYYYDRSKNPDKTNIQKTESGSDYSSFYFLSWDSNTPMSNPGYIDQNSALGTRLGIRKRLNDIDKLWAGADLGWSVYKKYIPYTTYSIPSGMLSTDLYNYSYNYSLTATIEYFLRPMEKHFSPYAGLGIGLAYDKFSQFFNIYGSSLNSYGLMVRPEVGVLIGFKEDSQWKIKAAAHFDYASNSAKLVDNDFITNNNYAGFVNLGFQIGIVKMAW